MTFSTKFVSFLNYLKSLQSNRYYSKNLCFKQNIFHQSLFVLINTNKGFINLSKLTELEIEGLLEENNFYWDNIIIRNIFSNDEIILNKEIESFIQKDNMICITIVNNISPYIINLSTPMLMH